MRILFLIFLQVRNLIKEIKNRKIDQLSYLRENVLVNAASEELINEIKNKIENGESFSELASGSKQEGGNLGWAGEGVYDDEFERQMDKVKSK